MIDLEHTVLQAYRAYVVADGRNEPAEKVEELRLRYLRLDRQMKSSRSTRKMLRPTLPLAVLAGR
jgi:hypothetical protein